MLGSLKNTYSGRQFEAHHPGAIVWKELVPQCIRQMPQEENMRRLLRQLDANGHSRGMRV